MECSVRGLVIFGGGLLLVACGVLPSKGDRIHGELRELPPSTKTIIARGLPDEGMEEIGRFPDLEGISFSWGWREVDCEITDQGIETLVGLDLQSLAMLDLGGCPEVSDRGISLLAALPSLQILHITRCPSLTDDALRAIAKMHNVARLDLRGCPGVTDVGVRALAERDNWRSVYLDGCESVTMDAVALFRQRCPDAVISKDDDAWSQAMLFVPN